MPPRLTWWDTDGLGAVTCPAGYLLLCFPKAPKRCLCAKLYRPKPWPDPHRIAQNRLAYTFFFAPLHPSRTTESGHFRYFHVVGLRGRLLGSASRYSPSSPARCCRQHHLVDCTGWRAWRQVLPRVAGPATARGWIVEYSRAQAIPRLVQRRLCL